MVATLDVGSSLTRWRRLQLKATLNLVTMNLGKKLRDKSGHRYGCELEQKRVELNLLYFKREYYRIALHRSSPSAPGNHTISGNAKPANKETKARKRRPRLRYLVASEKKHYPLRQIHFRPEKRSWGQCNRKTEGEMGATTLKKPTDRGY